MKKKYLVVAANAPSSILLQDGDNFLLREIDQPDKPMEGDPKTMVAMLTKWGFWPVEDPPTIADDEFAILDLVTKDDGSKVLRLKEIAPYMKVDSAASPPPMPKKKD